MTIDNYNKCVDMYSDNVYRFVLKSLKDSEQSKDIVQESFLRLWENRNIISEGKEKSYLFTIAYRLMIDNIRLKGRHINGYDNLEQKIICFDNSYNNAGEIIERVLSKLPDIQKKLILLRDYEGYSYKEIAEITSLNESQVKVYIFRARVSLKENLVSIEEIA